MASAPPHATEAPADAATGLPSAGARLGVGLALAVGVGLQLWSWSRVEGYELADVVEYLDRAQVFAQGGTLDPNSVRSFGFSALLVPLFWLVELLRLPEPAVVALARLMQMAFAAGAVVLVARTAARFSGPATAGAAAVGAAFLLAANPVLAQYAVAPLAGTAAAFFVALGTELGTRAPTVRRALGAGASLGAAVVVAYQCVPIVAPLWLALVLRRRWRRVRLAVPLALGALLVLLANGAVDWGIYGRFATSLESYLAQNVYGVLGSNLYRLGLETPARFFYSRLVVADESGAEARSQLPPDWYLTELDDRCLVLPALALVVLGVLFVLRRRAWIPLALLAIVVANVWLLSGKGSKSFRLWLPLLPALAVIGGLGAGALWSPGTIVWLRRAALVGALAGTVLLAPVVLRRVNFAQHGAYWQAVDILAETFQSAEGAPQARYASAYHWAVRFRDAKGLELDKFDYPLDRWHLLEPEHQDHVLRQFEELDGFVGHLQSVSQDPRLMRLVNERFEVVRVLDLGESMEDLEPVFVLRRRTGARDAHTFYEIVDTASGGDSPAAYQARIQHPASVDFRRREPDGTVRQIVFLGFDVDLDLAVGGEPWVTFHWYAGPGLEGRNYTLVDRWTDGVGNGWNHNHLPAYGAYTTTQWQPGEIVRESFLVTWPDRASEFGGAHLRGGVVPVELWLAIVEYDEADQQIGGLGPFRPSGSGPFARRGWGDGRRWTPDGLIAAGGFWWPVPSHRRLPDDGRPVDGVQ